MVDALIFWDIQRGDWCWSQKFEDGGNFLAGDLFEETEFKMEASTRIKVFCGEIYVMGRWGPLAII